MDISAIAATTLPVEKKVLFKEEQEQISPD